MYTRQGGLFEASGIGAYDNTGNWEWEYYPPPYDFLAPANGVAMPPPILAKRGVGCDCGGTCGGCGDHSHSSGIGLFDSTDFATWGWAEYLAIGGGLYLLFSLLGDAKSGAKKVQRVRSKSRRRAQARKQLESL